MSFQLSEHPGRVLQERIAEFGLGIRIGMAGFETVAVMSTVRTNPTRGMIMTMTFLPWEVAKWELSRTFHKKRNRK